MKLIIDIDENSYKLCKSLAPLTKEYISAVIGNGIPVSNEGDLISRSELKKAIEKYQIQWNKNCETDIAHWDSCECILGIIDNSPTVERPQGEWKFIQGVTTQGSLKCPFCNYRDYHKTNSNFCPKCGADMRGGAK